jgi:hypothetical protein
MACDYPVIEPEPADQLALAAGALARAAREVLPLIALPPERDEFLMFVVATEDALEGTR